MGGRTKSRPRITVADNSGVLLQEGGLARAEGWYEQGMFWHPHGDRATATTRFYLGAEQGSYVDYFTGLITVTDPETGEQTGRRAHFNGSHLGLWWEPPGQVIQRNDEVWLVEDCRDAVALALRGIKACAVLTGLNYPALALAPHRSTAGVTWVWALYGDPSRDRWVIRQASRMLAEGMNAAAALLSAARYNEQGDFHA